MLSTSNGGLAGPLDLRRTARGGRGFPHGASPLFDLCQINLGPLPGSFLPNLRAFAQQTPANLRASARQLSVINVWAFARHLYASGFPLGLPAPLSAYARDPEALIFLQLRSLIPCGQPLVMTDSNDSPGEHLPQTVFTLASCGNFLKSSKPVFPASARPQMLRALESTRL